MNLFIWKQVIEEAGLTEEEALAKLLLWGRQKNTAQCKAKNKLAAEASNGIAETDFTPRRGGENGGEPSLDEAYRACLKRKEGRRRPRTLQEIRGIYAQLLRRCPDIGSRPLRSFGSAEWQELLQRCYPSPRQRNKARAIMHSIFAQAVQEERCPRNPLQGTLREDVRESEIVPLSWEELQSLLRCATQPRHRACLPAMALMLWAGIRPAELRRLSWAEIDLQEKIVILRQRHSKTGGCRHVSIPPALARILRQARRHVMEEKCLICPANWERRWKALRTEAGLLPWRQDVLRHTYASYHLKRWHNLPLLQTEMGHRDGQLLLTRYLSMRGISSEHARRFWLGKVL